MKTARELFNTASVIVREMFVGEKLETKHIVSDITCVTGRGINSGNLYYGAATSEKWYEARKAYDGLYCLFEMEKIQGKKRTSVRPQVKEVALYTESFNCLDGDSIFTRDKAIKELARLEANLLQAPSAKQKPKHFGFKHYTA